VLLQKEERIKKLSTPVLSTASTLGLNTRRQNEKLLSFPVKVHTPKGKTQAWALLDYEAENSFIHQRWAKEHLPDAETPPRSVLVMDSYYIQSYGTRQLEISILDTLDT
jgi:hypothetical protein